MGRKKRPTDTVADLEIESLELDEMDASDEAVDLLENTQTALSTEPEGVSEEAAATEDEEPAPKPKRKSRKRKSATKELSLESESADETEVAAIAATVPSPEENGLPDKGTDLLKLIQSWEQSQSALLSQLEKLQQKVPAPKPPTNWAPLARVSFAASSIATVLAVLSLVLAQNTRNELLQRGEQVQASAPQQRPESLEAKAPNHTAQEIALGGLAEKAQLEISKAITKKPARPGKHRRR